MNLKSDIVNQYSDSKKVYINSIKYFGKYEPIYYSTHLNKKYMIYDKNNNKYVHFGQIPYKDFTKTNNEDKKNNYLKRATNIKGNWKNNKYSPNNLSINLLWK